MEGFGALLLTEVDINDAVCLWLKLYKPSLMFYA